MLQKQDRSEAQHMKLETQSLDAHGEEDSADSRRNAYYPDVDSGSIDADAGGGNGGVEVGEGVGLCEGSVECGGGT
jgi:hypothetical protein